MAETKIEWCDVVWNVTRGCCRVSLGCGGPGRVGGCYAERQALRFSGPGQPYKGLVRQTANGPRWTGRVELIPEKLDEPLHWRKPRRVFVNSMSDLFHEALPDEAIYEVFCVMALAPQHTFQVLTKRAKRMLEWTRSEPCAFVSKSWGFKGDTTASQPFKLPLPNVWLGVSVEDQKTADERIPLLLQTPAAKRFVSYEPALGSVDLGLQSATCSCCPRWASRWARLNERVWSDLPLRGGWASPGIYRAESNQHGALSVRDSTGKLLGIKPAEFEVLSGLDWVIIGGESGPGARPCDVSWIRSVVRQCREAGVACFVKQLGAQWARLGADHRKIGSHRPKHVDPKGGDPSEWPEDLRVREFPS